MRKIISIIAVLLWASSAFAWTAPIGIPDPPWPADLDVARPAVPSPWSENTAGFWYIKNGGTNVGNGYPADPRDSIDPASLSAGDVVVIEVGTVYPDTESFSVDGTSESPIWIMSSVDGADVVVSGSWTIGSAYTILDDIAFYGDCFSTASGYADHVLIRDGECYRDGTLISSYSSGIGLGGDDIVLYNNKVYNHGDWTADTEYDQHGIKVVVGGGNRIWVVDNELYHNQGDGIQVGDQNNTPEEITYVYIGRNTMYENLQSCAWTKNATHVVMSENTCYGISYSPGGSGQGLGGQYDATDVWFLFNTVHDCYSGIKMGGGSDGDGGPWYAIGNVLYSIESPESGASGSCNAYNYGALSYRNAGGFYAFHNTVYEADSFVCTVPAANQYVRNNIFSDPLSTSLACPQINTQTYPAMDFNLYSSGSIRFGYDGGTAGAQGVEYTTVSGFASGETQEQNSPTPASASFVNAATADFTLQAGSPAIDASNTTEEAVYDTFYSTYGVSIKVDRAGTARAASATDWDMGAYEYTAGGDVTAPTVTISTSDPQNIAVDSLAIAGTASDAVGVSSCKYRIGAAPDGSNGTALTGTTEWSGTATGFSEGANTLYAGCTDAAGNWGSDSITVNYTILTATHRGMSVSGGGFR